MKRRPPLSATADKRLELEFLAAQGNTQHGIQARKDLQELNERENNPVQEPASTPALATPATAAPAAEVAESTPHASAPEPNRAPTDLAASESSLPVSGADTAAAITTPVSNSPAPTSLKEGRPRGRRSKASTAPAAEATPAPIARNEYFREYRQERATLLVARPYNVVLRQIAMALESDPNRFLPQPSDGSRRRFSITDVTEMAISQLAEKLRSQGAPISPLPSA